MDNLIKKTVKDKIDEYMRKNRNDSGEEDTTKPDNKRPKKQQSVVLGSYLIEYEAVLQLPKLSKQVKQKTLSLSG